MPTSAAVDRVAAAKGLSCHETPTGWKFFGNLLDDGQVRLCGEESAGTGGDHVREKDGLWAVLLWLNILAKTKLSVAELMSDHWSKYGRNYYTRHDYEAVESDVAAQIVNDLRSNLPSLVRQSFAGLNVTSADEFSYTDPVDESISSGQGIRILLEGDARIVIRLSGTGTEGATIRVYIEQLESDPTRLNQEPQDALSAVIASSEAITGIRQRTGRDAPDVIT
jgi:phosphoglucomutase